MNLVCLSMLQVDTGGNRMRIAIAALMGLVLGQCAGYCQNPAAGAASPSAWEDISSWANVHPIETENIIFANVPLIPNPSASPDPGTPNGIRTQIPGTSTRFRRRSRRPS
jgi:hypothetical protein